MWPRRLAREEAASDPQVLATEKTRAGRTRPRLQVEIFCNNSVTKYFPNPLKDSFISYKLREKVLWS
jgi:hypothetical protein